MSDDFLQKNNLKFIDFCAGIGAGRLGLEYSNFQCIGYSEIDKHAENTYSFIHGNELAFGDLTTINPKELPDFDILISGFPCQTFSIVGKRSGLEDENKGQIIFYLVNILKEKHVKYFLLENVKGLINHDKGNTFKIIQELLDEAGYKIFYKVLNSIDFGVPQMRERIYIVGIKKEIFTLDNFVFPDKLSQQYKIEDFLCDTREEFVFDETQKSFKTFQNYLSNKYNINKYNLQEILEKDYLVLDTRQSDLRLYNNRIPTIRRDRQGILYVKNKKLRKLSGYEALLLQGFTPKHALIAKENQTNKNLLAQAGNAMTVNVISAIAKKIYEYNLNLQKE